MPVGRHPPTSRRIRGWVVWVVVRVMPGGRFPDMGELCCVIVGRRIFGYVATPKPGENPRGTITTAADAAHSGFHTQLHGVYSYRSLFNIIHLVLCVWHSFSDARIAHRLEEARAT